MKRVFVLAKRSLFSQGIMNLLDAEPQLTVVGWEADPVKALQCIEETQPDTVLHIRDNHSTPPLLTNERLMHLGLKIKIIELSLGDTSVDVYQREHLVITGIGDLIGVI